MRRALTKRERAAMWTDQGGACKRCSGPLGQGFVAEHWVMVALGNAAKPDCLLCKTCAHEKTNGPRGDITTYHRAKRLAEARTQYDKRKRNGPKLKGGAKLAGRGLDKTKRKTMSGKVVPRGETK
mgnify:FL=1